MIHWKGVKRKGNMDQLACLTLTDPGHDPIVFYAPGSREFSVFGSLKTPCFLLQFCRLINMQRKGGFLEQTTCYLSKSVWRIVLCHIPNMEWKKPGCNPSLRKQRLLDAAANPTTFPGIFFLRAIDTGDKE